MKKKILSTMLFGTMIVPCVFMMSACGAKHEAVAEWSKDANNHWHACSVKECEEIFDKAEHKYDSTTNICVCGQAIANAVAIVDGKAVTELTSAAVANKTITLLKDYTGTAFELNGTTVEAATKGLKLNAVVMSGEVTLKNISTQNITVNTNFNGTLTFEGGVLEAQTNGTAAFLRNAEGAQADYVFKNMTVKTGTEKGIKIQRAKSVKIENCEFDGTALSSETKSDISQTRSLSAIDITIEGTTTDETFAKTNITITGCTFKNIGFADDKDGNDQTQLDTAGAIKIKNQMTANGGIGEVTITGNKFENVCRDIVIGKAKEGDTDYQTRTWAKDSAWTVSGNTSTYTETSVKEIQVKTEATNTKIGKIVGGCAVFDIGDAYPESEEYPYSVKFVAGAE